MWVNLAIEAATAIAKGYQERKANAEANDALANKIIDAIKQELDSVKNDILHKLDDLQKEELQGLLRGYLNNFALYNAGMPDEVAWLQRLIGDANNLSGRMYVIFKRYIDSKDYYNSRDLFAMYAPLITTYIYLLNEMTLYSGYESTGKYDNTAVIINTINADILPGVNDFLELMAAFTNSRYSAVKETFYPEPEPDEDLSFIILSYDVLDGMGKSIEVDIMTYVKNRQQYEQEIAIMREEAIEAEILKLKEQTGIIRYIDEIKKISDNIFIEIVEENNVA